MRRWAEARWVLVALSAGAGVVACGPAATPPVRSPATPPAGAYVPFTDISKDLADRNQDLAWMGAHPLYVLASPTVRYFVAPARCGQGPYEIHIPVSSTAWIELWRTYLLSPRALKGRDAEQQGERYRILHDAVATASPPPGTRRGPR